MDQRRYLLLFVLVTLAILLPLGVLSAEGESDKRREEVFLNTSPSRSGLEVSEYGKLKVLIELLSADKVIGLTREKLEKKCEIRLKQAGIEPVGQKDECLYVKVDLLRDAYAMSIGLSRTILFKKNGNIYRKCGAPTWQKNIIGLHRGNVRYVFECLDSLLDDFISEYLKANSK